jgi:hypothetical protein
MSNPKLFPPSPAHCAVTSIGELISTARVITVMANIAGLSVKVDPLFRERHVIWNSPRVAKKLKTGERFERIASSLTPMNFILGAGLQRRHLCAVDYVDVDQSIPIVVE